MEILTLSHYQLEVGGNLLLSINQLHLHQGDKVFLIGDNGSGKTSFLQTLIGERRSYQGQLSLHSDVAYLPQLQAAQNQSGGEKVMASLKVLFQKNASLLILDEPSSHLDKANQKWLIHQLKRYRGTLLVVSHDRYLMNQIAQQIWVIEKQDIKVYQGNYDAYRQVKELEMQKQAIEKANYQRQVTKLTKQIQAKKERANQMVKPKKNISRSDWKVNAFAGSYDSQAKRIAKSAKAMENRLAKLTPNRQESKEIWAKLKFNPQEKKIPHTLIHLREGNLSRNKQILFTYPDIAIRADSKLAIIGRNKAGKSTFLESLANQDLPGFYSDHLKLTFFKQDQVQLDSQLTAFEFVQEQSNQDSRLILNYLAMMGIPYQKAHQKIASLSGGERVRLALVGAMLGDHQLLILDEPTNYLDLVAMEALERCLKQYPYPFVLVSHDQQFVSSVVNRCYVIRDGQLEEIDKDHF
ncbi:ATP-binding cassette domain-containing protein [Streptococcus dysgalactiae]|uniref:ATP-binding cassette domain-containing protein n=1 Tax=Streptococcus dysgalactiae TaxID=1334 RepID=UPI0008248272|nr:ATP-binding cassette domain-containing protein [Streptococcus dysgalactiae]OCW98825.1 ABC transporter ATP-binding protein [Streptococcus dysgalactiae subsp. equisimilis]